MTPRVKICGLTNLADARAALDAGADALGFILYPPSKRYIPAAEAAAIAREIPPFVSTVAVLVNAEEEWNDSAWVEAIEAFDFLQLHGSETADEVERLATCVKVIKAFPADFALTISPDDYAAAAAFLIDTPSPQHGGTGQTFDWNLALKFKARTTKPVLLSGGLNPENVAEAIQLVQPYGIDVASGVEFSPGRKDHAKLRDFLHICKSL